MCKMQSQFKNKKKEEEEEEKKVSLKQNMKKKRRPCDESKHNATNKQGNLMKL